ncbi:hypothetical protein [Borrelia persica]|uniref:hypothetical protein n=1 Tax=Borrelia persica TaxID=44448 RepID=UPI00135F1771|nr:hypothetical protein [Borrelia persica]
MGRRNSAPNKSLAVLVSTLEVELLSCGDVVFLAIVFLLRFFGLFERFFYLLYQF